MKIAAVIDSRTVAINRGSDSGRVKTGDRLRITNTITDPENGKVLGFYPELEVVVTEVFAKFCIATTLPAVKKRPDVTVNIGDDVFWERK